MGNFCNDPSCYNYQRYCRLHKVEVIKPASKIKKVSSSLKEELKKYTKIAKAFLALHTKCAVCGGPSECIHHKAGRIGKLLTMVKYFLAVCFMCHRRIEENPEWAKENGYSVDRLTLTDPELNEETEQELLKTTNA